MSENCLVSPSEREAGVLSVLVPAVAEPSSLTSGWGWKLDSLCDGARMLPIPMFSIASQVSLRLLPACYPALSDASHRVWNAFSQLRRSCYLVTGH